MLKGGKIFDFRPRAISEQLGLKTPGNGWCYQQAAAYGHFGRDIFPWEKTDKVAALQAFSN
jgi:S-adenosylmethionine synthetase